MSEHSTSKSREAAIKRTFDEMTTAIAQECKSQESAITFIYDKARIYVSNLWKHRNPEHSAGSESEILEWAIFLATKAQMLETESRQNCQDLAYSSIRILLGYDQNSADNSGKKISPPLTNDELQAMGLVRMNDGGVQTSLFSEDDLEKVRSKAVAKVLPRLLSRNIDNHLIPNNYLTNILTDGIIDAGKVSMLVSSSKAKPIHAFCNLSFDGDNVKLSGRQPFTEYDRNVYNAVTSLYVYGDQSHIITPDIVYRAMTGMNASETPSPQQTGAVTKSLDKMRFIRAVIDCTEELEARHATLDGVTITGGLIDTYLLNAKAVQVQAGGRTVKAYQILEQPVLYTYSKALNQVYTVPVSLLDVKRVDSKTGKTEGRISNTESRIRIKGYLLRRIEGMKGKNALASRTIVLYGYEKNDHHHPGLYEIAGSVDPDRRDTARIRGYVEQVLDYWVTEGYIAGYAWDRSGTQITSVTIKI